MVIIREAQNKDYDRISELEQEVLALHASNRPDVYRYVENALSKDKFEQMLNSDTSKVFVAVNDENSEVAAFIILLVKTIPDMPMIIPGKFVHVDDLCVNKAYRHKGIGRMLFEYVKTYAKSINAQSVELKVWEFNQDAVKFYESLGMSTRNRMMEIKL